MCNKLRAIVLLYLLFFLSQCIYAQDGGLRLGPYAYKNAFKSNSSERKRLSDHRHVPVKNGVTAYTKYGEKVKLEATDTISVADIYEGAWDGKKGKWILFYDLERAGVRAGDLYVLLKEMKDVEDSARETESIKDNQRQVSVKILMTVFLTSVLPIVILLLATLYFFRKFYLKVSGVFAKVSGERISGCLGLLILGPVAFVVEEAFSSGYTQHYDEMMGFIYKTLNVDPAMLQTTDFSQVSFWQSFHYVAMMLLIGIAAILFAWIGTSLMFSGLIAIFTSGTPATAHGTSTDGGRTIFIHSITPGADGPDVDFSAVVKFWLIYSIVFPLMFFFVEIFLGINNWIGVLLTALIFTSVVTIVYKLISKRNQRFAHFVSTFALSFLGFATTIVLLLFVVIVVKLLVVALAG